MFLCLIWGTTWLAIRILVRYVAPFKAAAVRFFLAAAILLVWALLRGIKFPKPGPQWNATLVLGFTMMALPYGLLFWAEQYVGSSIAAILYSAMPLIVALLTPLMTGRKVPRQAVFALTLAFGALIVLFDDALSGSRREIWSGVAVLIALLSSSWSALYAKERLKDVDPVTTTGVQVALGAVGLCWAAWVFEARHAPAVWNWPALIALVFLAAFGSAAAFAVYYWLLKHMQPYQLSTISLVVPVVAVIEGVLFGGDRITVTMVASMAVILGSVGAVLKSEAQGPEIISIKEGNAV